MKRGLYIIIAVIFVLTPLFIWQEIYLPKDSHTTEEKMFLVKSGEGAKEIALNLEKTGLIKNGNFFRIYVLTVGQSKLLKAGWYQLSPAMNFPEIVKKLSIGKIVKLQITFPEGFTMQQMEEKINTFLQEEYQSATLETEPVNLAQFKIMQFQNQFELFKNAPSESSLEGFLFPDTYEIDLGMDSGLIVTKLLANFDKKLPPELREEIEKQGKSIFEMVTLASLLEKEVKTLEDRKLVAGILLKRLESGVPLQVDATISYITREKTVKISKEETEIDSPYNTYKYRGLPLGPICNPGIESITAAIYPTASEYWYYLSAPDGKTIFSRTLEEHNIAKAIYLK